MPRIPSSDRIPDAPYRSARRPLSYGADKGELLAPLKEDQRNAAAVDALARVVGNEGQRWAAFAEEEQRRRGEHEQALAEIGAQRDLIALEESLKDDPNTATHVDRFKKGVSEIADRYATDISDPVRREHFLLRLQKDSLHHATRINDRVRRVAIDQARAGLDDLLTNLRKRATSPDASDDELASARKIAANAIARMVARPEYLSHSAAKRLFRDFSNALVRDRVLSLVDSGDLDGARSVLKSTDDLTPTQKHNLTNIINARERRANAEDRARVIGMWQDHMQSLRDAGEGVVDLPDERLKKVLTENEFARWKGQEREARGLFEATRDFKSMPDEAIASRLEGLRSSLDPSRPGYAVRKRVLFQAEKQAARIEKQRRNDPAGAVWDFPEVADARKTGNPQAVVGALLDAQAKLGIPSFARAAITRAEANEIMGEVRRAMQSGDDVAAMRALEKTIGAIDKTYGPYAQEVLDSALRLSGNMSKDESALKAAAIRRLLREGEIDKDEWQSALSFEPIARSEMAIDPTSRNAPPVREGSGQSLMLDGLRIGRSPVGISVPHAAINYLRSHPETWRQFASKYGLDRTQVESLLGKPIASE